MMTGEFGKSVGGGSGKLEMTTVVICCGTGTTVELGTLDGKTEAGTITPVVDGTVTTVTVDGTTEAGTNTGDDGNTDCGGNEMVTMLGGAIVGVITCELTIGMSVGISDNGTDDGMMVVIDGAITIVLDVSKEYTKIAGADGDTFGSLT
jgi:hypothetical protein